MLMLKKMISLTDFKYYKKAIDKNPNELITPIYLLEPVNFANWIIIGKMPACFMKRYKKSFLPVMKPAI